MADPPHRIRIHQKCLVISFDNSDGLFAIKVVELLRRSDGERRQWFRNEFGVTLPWKWRTNLGNYMIASLRTAMGHLRVMGSMFSFLNYAMALSMAGMS